MGRTFRNPRDVAAFFSRLASEAPAKMLATAEQVVELSYEGVQHVIGHSPPLQELQESTIQQKDAHGAPYPDKPLIDTESLQHSFETAVLPAPGGFVMGTGTPDPVMLYHEEGTGHVPPRPLVHEAGREASRFQVIAFLLGALSIATDRPPTIHVRRVPRLMAFARPPRRRRRA